MVTLFYRRDFLFSIYTKYFTLSYSYAHPVLNSLPFNSLVQGLITNIVLLVCTPNEIFVKKIGSGISSVRLKEKEYTQKIIHIPKPEIKRFEIKDYSALGLFSIGYW
ncbi:TPA: hypothetical protein ACGYUM_002137 [Enterococcus faecium]|uniref:hypothetical protein n=1 Tax=Enterococcus faecium TaxID=1352 RepID=UPI001F5D54FB|nr:hypothetical protein [Enterococcus faecium]